MSRELLNSATVVGTAASAALAEPILHTMGLIFMGAFGGALFALMNQPSTDLWPAGLRFAVGRWVLSQCCSWPVMVVLDGVATSYSWSIPRTALLIFTAFAVACPRELGRELKELVAAIPLRLKKE